MVVANSGQSHTNCTTAIAGSSITFTAVCAHHAAHAVVTNFTGPAGNPGAGALLVLEGSMDGTAWVTLPEAGEVKITGNGTYRLGDTSIPQPALFLRANVKAIDPGVSLTVNSVCASV